MGCGEFCFAMTIWAVSTWQVPKGLVNESKNREREGFQEFFGHGQNFSMKIYESHLLIPINHYNQNSTYFLFLFTLAESGQFFTVHLNHLESSAFIKFLQEPRGGQNLF